MRACPKKLVGIHCESDIGELRGVLSGIELRHLGIIIVCPGNSIKEASGILDEFTEFQLVKTPKVALEEGIYLLESESFPVISDGSIIMTGPSRYSGLTSVDRFFKSIGDNFGPAGAGLELDGDSFIGLTFLRGSGGLALSGDDFSLKHPEMAEIIKPLGDGSLLKGFIHNTVSQFDKRQVEKLQLRADRRERQQAVLAGISLMALREVSLEEMIHKAIMEIGQTLEVEYVELLRYKPEENLLKLIDGVGWKPGYVGNATVPDKRDSQAGYTLLQKDTVITEDLRAEDRFTGPDLLLDHEVISGMTCVINHTTPAYGVLGVHTRQHRIFTRDEANFVSSVANLLSAAIRDRKIQEQLFKSEEQFRTMANSIPQLAWMTDKDGWIFWYNQRWFEYTGSTLEEMKGWGWKKVHHPDHVDRVVEKFTACIARGVNWEDTFPLRRHDGFYRWFLSRALPIRNESGEIVNWFGTNTDVTQQLQTEKSLFESEQKLRIAKNSGNVGAFEYHLQTEKTEWDPLLKELWGVPDYRKPTQVDFWNGIHPDDKESTSKALNQAVDPDGDGHYFAEYRVVNLITGKVSYIEASGQVLFEDRVPIKMIGLIIDMTHRKNLENSLQEVVRELEAQNTKKNEFLATLGHELRNPLASISGGIQLLEIENPDLKELKIMSNGVNQMSSLLDDLLDLTRIERGKIKLDKKPVDLSAIFLSVANGYQSMMIAKNQDFVVENAADRVIVHGDETRLEQIISNLLTNANKFTDQNGKVSAFLEKGDNGEAVIRISDSGIGLNEDMLGKIFDPFEQVPHTGNSGLGIGLSLVRQFVQMHGGTIDVDSRGLQQGSTFTVRIPTIEDSDFQPGIEDDRDETKHIRKDMKVLIVEDNLDAARGLKALLDREGCEVRIAENGRDTLKMIYSYQPDVFIMDIGLPDIDGYTLAKQVREQVKGDPTFIAHTGYGHESARAKSRIAGFDYHLNKPVKLSEVINILSHL